MRVISGEAKGRRLKTPGDERIRPTADKIKGALFSIIGERVRDAHVLDLFAGTGNLGIEALSRGARFVHFVDADKGAESIIRENLIRVKFEDRACVWRTDAITALSRLERTGQRFDLIFSDPPYGRQLNQKALAMLSNGEFIVEDGLVVLEHHRKELFPPQKTALLKIDERRFGETVLTFYHQKVES